MSIKEYANQLADVLLRIEDAKVEAAAIADAAKDAGVNVAALRKVAREMVMDATKLAKKYESEEQLDMFRQEVGIFKSKGLETSDKAYRSRQAKREVELVKSAKAFDAVAGTNLAEGYQKDQAAIRKWDANRDVRD